MIFKYFYDDFYIDSVLILMFFVEISVSLNFFSEDLSAFASRTGNRRKNRTVEIRERYGCGMCQVKSAEGARYILEIK